MLTMRQGLYMHQSSHFILSGPLGGSLVIIPIFTEEDTDSEKLDHLPDLNN